MPSHPQGGAQVVGEPPGVGARGAGEAEAQTAVRDLPQGGEFVDGDLLGLGRHLLSPAGQLVVLHSLDLLGGVGGRLLLDLPLEAAHGLGQRRDVERRHRLRRRLGDHLAGSVVGVGGDAEADHPFVDLGRPDQEAGEARRRAERQQQQAGGVRVEGAAMADLLLLQHPPRFLDGVVRGESRLLVEQQQAVFHLRHEPSAAPNSDATSRRTSSPSPGMVKPAALRCPPPP